MAVASVPREAIRHASAAIGTPVIERAGLYVVLGLGALVMLLPFIWMVSTSLKTQAEIFQSSTSLFPIHPTFDAYQDVWVRIPFGRFFLNTVVFTGGVTTLSLLFDSMTAYALARLEFRGREVVFWLVLLTMMVPFQITLIPLFITVFQIGWINTFWGLIVPRATSAFGIFLLRQFFVSLPKELDDAARIDGASELRVYWQIVLPLAAPPLATLGTFHFMNNWNDLMWPLVITSSIEMRTVPSGLALFMGNFVIEHAVLMAGATIGLLPLAIAFLFGQRYFVRGVVMTGLK